MSSLLNPLTFPLHGTRLIEASAGTGKTYTLAALYLRLVLGHGEGVSRALLPPDILVVTFTEAATRELRERIRARLAQAAQCFAGRAAATEQDPFLQQLLADYPADQHAACAARLEGAAQWMDEAAIYTIHGFCHRMLRQHAFDSGSLFQLELNQDEQPLRERATADYWRSFVYALPAAQLHALHQHWSTPKALLDAVKPMLNRTQYFPEPTQTPAQIVAEWQHQCHAMVSELRTRWRGWLEQLDALFVAAWQENRLEKSNPARRADILRWFASIRAWLDDDSLTSPKLSDTFFLRLNAESLAAASDKIAEIVAHPAIAAITELRNIESRLPTLPALLLPHAAHWISQRLERDKRRHGMIGYDDMLSRLADALNSAQGAQLATIIRRQFPVAMIDEFQDTDPTQYQVFATLYQQQPATSWLMIGDPKQAIYAFRGADIHTYLSARRATAGNHYTLAKNFRSSTALVNAVNHLFDYGTRYPAGSFLYGDIPFQPVQANGRREQLLIDNQPVSALTLWQLLNDADDPSISKTDYLREMAERSASAMVQLLNLAADNRCGFAHGEALTPLRQADMAVLVRDGGEAAAMRAALARRGLRSVYLSDRDSVFASNEAGDLLSWLQAAAEPASEQKIRTALASRTLALSWQQLDALSRDEQQWEDTVEQFYHYHRLWRQLGVLPMLRALLRDYQLPARLLANDDERALTNLLHLAELAQRAAAKLDGEMALVRWLAGTIDSDQQQTNSDNNKDAILRLESDADLIRVVTIHKAKGLEYPLVFLPFICTFRAEQGKHPPLRFHDHEQQLRYTLTPSAEQIADADRERLAEDLRLLYVAVTRARHACWLGMAPVRTGSSKNVTQLAQSAIGYLLTGGAELPVDGLPEALAALAGHCNDIEVQPAPASSETCARLDNTRVRLQPARDYQGPPAEHWWIASYSALQPEAISAGDVPRQVSDEVLAEEPAGPAHSAAPVDNNIHGFVRGPQAGTLLHALLEQAADQGFAASLNERRPDWRARLARRLGVAGWQAWQPCLEQWFDDYLRTPLPLGEQSLCLADLPRQQCQPEMEFWIQASAVSTEALDQLVRRYLLPGQPRPALRAEQLNGMLKGFIDLVLVDQGRYFVADYKSNWLGADDSSYSPAAMARAVLDKRYDVQLCLYLLALHRLLGARLGADYQPAQQLGGAALLFLRGLYSDSRGVFMQPATAALVTALDALFRGQPLTAERTDE